MIHELKTHGSFFQAILKGNKTFEVRKFDREFEVGDGLLLQDYDPGAMRGWRYTGRELLVKVTYLMEFTGVVEVLDMLPQRYAIMGFTIVEKTGCNS
jgi:hypothetical protein